MKTKNIWIVSYYTQPPEFDTHLRHRKFADYLRKSGYNVTIISGSFLHAKNINLITGKKKYIECDYNGEKYIHIKTRSYSNNGIGRMLSIFQFAYRLFRLRNFFESPSIIIHNAHVPFDVLVARCAKKLKAKYVVEVWDLWPESFVALGLVRNNNPLLWIAYQMEKNLYRKADRIIFTMEGGKDYIVEKKWDEEHGGPVNLDKVFYINNGLDLKDFELNKQHCRFEDKDLEESGIFKVIYLGSIRLANDIRLLVDAAELLKEYKHIRFLIYGDGTERENLEAYCRQNQINNVIFKQKWVPLKNVPYILSCGSLNVLNYKVNSIERFGGSQGKLFQYMASEKPICSNQVMGYDLILKYEMGIARNLKTPQEYAAAILSFVTMNKADYDLMCGRARRAAEEFDFGRLYERLKKMLDGIK